MPSSLARWPRLCAALLLMLGATPLRAQNASETDPVVVDAETETVINGALRFLAARQAGNGSWSASEGGRGAHAVAMTGYVLLAFMAAGHLPEEGEFARQVRDGMQFLLDQVQPDGLFRGVDGSKYMYNHGIASIALAELYGQTRSPAIRTKLERLVRLIVTTQGEQGDDHGGWRYRPRPADADISVTVLQVVALRSAKNAGLNVPQKTLDDAIAYVRRCSVPSTGGFSYQARRGAPGFARTAAAIYSLQVCGQYDDPLVKAGSEYLFRTGHPGGRHWTYGANYAAPAQYMIGGAAWKRWYAFMKQHLLTTATRHSDQLSWSGEVSDIYCTAAHAAILAMPYHYIPLYQR